MGRALRPPVLLIALVALAACGPPDPLERLRKELSDVPEYSVVLHDMRQQGNFIEHFEHQYRVIYAQALPAEESPQLRDQLRDWVPVSRSFYERHEPHLGMVLLAKQPDQQAEATAEPPGYRYVGDSRYGQWRTDGSGTSFWEFYGKYALLSHIFGTSGRRIDRPDWDLYRRERRANRPYFGPKGEFGTRGAYTRTTQPTFFERQQARTARRQQKFSEKVNRRIQRSRMTSTRSRSGSRGGK